EYSRQAADCAAQSRYRRAYAPFASSSSSCVPASSIRPCSSTTIRPAPRIVDRRCAITIAVRPASSRRSPCSICDSVRTSTFEVASSRIRMRGSAAAARANATSCRCPADRCPPRSPTSVSYPSGSRSMNSCAPTACAAARISSSVASGCPNARLSRIVAVDQHAPLVGVVEARDQLRQRRLPGTGLAHQGERLPGRHRERHVLERGRLAPVGERHVLEPDLAAYARQVDGVWTVRDVRVLVQQLEDLVERG